MTSHFFGWWIFVSLFKEGGGIIKKNFGALRSFGIILGCSSLRFSLQDCFFNSLFWRPFLLCNKNDLEPIIYLYCFYWGDASSDNLIFMILKLYYGISKYCGQRFVVILLSFFSIFLYIEKSWIILFFFFCVSISLRFFGERRAFKRELLVNGLISIRESGRTIPFEGRE